MIEFISGGDGPANPARPSPEAERRLMEALSLAGLLAAAEVDPADVELVDASSLRDVAAVLHRLISEAHELLHRDAPGE